MVADSYGQWQGFANQQDQIAASNYFASIQAAQRARQIAADEEARRYNAWVESQRYIQNQAAQQAQEAEREREWTSEFGLRKSTGEQNLDLTRKYYNWQMTKPDERLAGLKDHAMSVALNMVQQGFTPDIAAQATGLDETSYERTAPVYNFLADESQKQADNAESLAKVLNDSAKTVQEYESIFSKEKKTKEDTAALGKLMQKLPDAKKLIASYPKWIALVGQDENNAYFSKIKRLPKFNWKAGGGQSAPSETDHSTDSTTGLYPGTTDEWAGTTPADMGAPQALMPQIRKPVFLGPYVPAAMVRNNDAMAAQYANQLMAQYPGLTRDQAKVAARKLFP